jgi:hypothetical protein
MDYRRNRAFRLQPSISVEQYHVNPRMDLRGDVRIDRVIRTDSILKNCWQAISRELGVGIGTLYKTVNGAKAADTAVSSRMTPVDIISV